MISIQSYSDWAEERRQEWAAYLATLEPSEHPHVQCRKCDGDGYIECDLGHEHECETCEGEGRIPKEPDDKRTHYFDAVIAEIREVCAWTRRDFLAEVGPFVRDFRGYGSQQERTAA